MAERPTDDVALADADQLVHEQAVLHVAQQTSAELVAPFPRPPSPVPQDDVRISRHRLPKDRAVAVTRALGAGARRRLEVVDEALHDATFHEARGARRHTLIVQG